MARPQCDIPLVFQFCVQGGKIKNNKEQRFFFFSYIRLPPNTLENVSHVFTLGLRAKGGGIFSKLEKFRPQNHK
jgi:hypothetical protein